MTSIYLFIQSIFFMIHIFKVEKFLQFTFKIIIKKLMFGYKSEMCNFWMIEIWRNYRILITLIIEIAKIFTQEKNIMNHAKGFFQGKIYVWQFLSLGRITRNWLICIFEIEYIHENKEKCSIDNN